MGFLCLELGQTSHLVIATSQALREREGNGRGNLFRLAEAPHRDQRKEATLPLSGGVARSTSDRISREVRVTQLAASGVIS
jgi:hypothetical protein